MATCRVRYTHQTTVMHVEMISHKQKFRIWIKVRIKSYGDKT